MYPSKEVSYIIQLFSPDITPHISLTTLVIHFHLLNYIVYNPPTLYKLRYLVCINKLDLNFPTRYLRILLHAYSPYDNHLIIRSTCFIPIANQINGYSGRLDTLLLAIITFKKLTNWFSVSRL